MESASEEECRSHPVGRARDTTNSWTIRKWILRMFKDPGRALEIYIPSNVLSYRSTVNQKKKENNPKNEKDPVHSTVYLCEILTLVAHIMETAKPATDSDHLICAGRICISCWKGLSWIGCPFTQPRPTYPYPCFLHHISIWKVILKSHMQTDQSCEQGKTPTEHMRNRTKIIFVCIVRICICWNVSDRFLVALLREK